MKILTFSFQLSVVSGIDFLLSALLFLVKAVDFRA